MSNDFDDEDAPPELIDVSAMPADQTSVDEAPTARVPITLVTGMYRWTAFQFTSNFETNTLIRIPGRRKNNPVELHPHRETRQENCRHHEWFVNSTYHIYNGLT
jgi:hypothetical protein